MHFSNDDYSALVERYGEKKADAFVRATAERNLAQIKQTEAFDQKIKRIGTDGAIRMLLKKED